MTLAAPDTVINNGGETATNKGSSAAQLIRKNT